MAAKSQYTMAYQSDIPKGGKAGDGKYDINFSIRAGYDDCIPADLYGSPNGSCICGVGSLFTPRYLQAKFSVAGGGTGLSRDCAVIKFPVPRPEKALIEAMIAKLRTCGAICIDYVGESWNTVPPKIGQYTPTNAPIFAVSVGVRSLKVTGKSSIYISEALGGNQVVSVQYEAEPFDLTGAALSGRIVTPGGAFETCHGTLDKSAACAIGNSLKPRKAILAFQYQVTGAGIGGAAAKRGRREAPIVDFSKVLNCIGDFGNIPGVNCVGYEGESISRIDLFV